MAVRSPTLSVDDQDYYPLHEEDDVPEIPPHRRRVTYLQNALEARFPGWFVTGNVCIYWQRGNTKKYRAPDLLLVKEPLRMEDGFLRVPEAPGLGMEVNDAVINQYRIA